MFAKKNVKFNSRKQVHRVKKVKPVRFYTNYSSFSTSPTFYNIRRFILKIVTFNKRRLWTLLKKQKKLFHIVYGFKNLPEARFRIRLCSFFKFHNASFRTLKTIRRRFLTALFNNVNIRPSAWYVKKHHYWCSDNLKRSRKWRRFFFVRHAKRLKSIKRRVAHAMARLDRGIYKKSLNSHLNTYKQVSATVPNFKLTFPLLTNRTLALYFAKRMRLGTMKRIVFFLKTPLAIADTRINNITLRNNNDLRLKLFTTGHSFMDSLKNAVMLKSKREDAFNEASFKKYQHWKKMPNSVGFRPRFAAAVPYRKLYYAKTLKNLFKVPHQTRNWFDAELYKFTALNKLYSKSRNPLVLRRQNGVNTNEEWMSALKKNPLPNLFWSRYSKVKNFIKTFTKKKHLSGRLRVKLARFKRISKVWGGLAGSLDPDSLLDKHLHLAKGSLKVDAMTNWRYQALIEASHQFTDSDLNLAAHISSSARYYNLRSFYRLKLLFGRKYIPTIQRRVYYTKFFKQVYWKSLKNSKNFIARWKNFMFIVTQAKLFEATRIFNISHYIPSCRPATTITGVLRKSYHSYLAKGAYKFNRPTRWLYNRELRDQAFSKSAGKGDNLSMGPKHLRWNFLKFIPLPTTRKILLFKRQPALLAATFSFALGSSTRITAFDSLGIRGRIRCRALQKNVPLTGRVWAKTNSNGFLENFTKLLAPIKRELLKARNYGLKAFFRNSLFTFSKLWRPQYNFAKAWFRKKLALKKYFMRFYGFKKTINCKLYFYKALHKAKKDAWLDKIFNWRLDTIFVRLLFLRNIQVVHKLITKGHVFVNGYLVTSSEFLLSTLDCISLSMLSSMWLKFFKKYVYINFLISKGFKYRNYYRKFEPVYFSQLNVFLHNIILHKNVILIVLGDIIPTREVIDRSFVPRPQFKLLKWFLGVI